MVVMNTFTPAPHRPSRPVRSALLTLLVITVGSVLVAIVVGMMLRSALSWLGDRDETVTVTSSAEIPGSVRLEMLPDASYLG